MEPFQNISRRTFLGRSTQVAVGVGIATPLAAEAQSGTRSRSSDSARKRVVLVGTGSRGISMWGRALVGPYAEYVEMVGLCDINPKRVQVAREFIGVDAPTYVAGDFDRMIRETRPEMVIVTTTDCYHADYIVRAMELGCDVLSEKPVATDASQCQRIREAEMRTGRKLLVGFNARHGRAAEEIKKVLMSGVLGRIRSAEFQEYLDTNHGASYFHRWHGRAKYSGTLLVHKASHHFDQMNWWLDADPVEVHAFGRVAYYGRNNPFRGVKCRGCPHKEKCRHYRDITKSETAMKLYVACEDFDGYAPDLCVWDNEIDSYDTQTVEVQYNNDVLLNYSLSAYNPYEGQRISFGGENGRLDVRVYQAQPWEVDYEADFQLTENFKNATRTWRVGGQQEIDLGDGGHGGADGKLKDLLFKPGHPDPLQKRAGSHAGIMSSLIGIAARTSIETGRRVRISDMVNVPASWDWS